MKRAVLTGLVLLSLGCATFRNADGSLNIVGILVDARWGLQEACDQRWVPSDDCIIGLDAFTVAEGIAAKNVPTTKAAVRQVLVDIEDKQPRTSRLRPYLDAVIALLT